MKGELIILLFCVKSGSFRLAVKTMSECPRLAQAVGMIVEHWFV